MPLHAQWSKSGWYPFFNATIMQISSYISQWKAVRSLCTFFSLSYNIRLQRELWEKQKSENCLEALRAFLDCNYSKKKSFEASGSFFQSTVVAQALQSFGDVEQTIHVILGMSHSVLTWKPQNKNDINRQITGEKLHYLCWM